MAFDDDDDCPKSKDEYGTEHCQCYWDCEPCCWCGSDPPNPDCDCPKHGGADAG